MNLFNKMKEDGDNMKQKKRLLKEMNQLEIFVWEYMVVRIRTHQMDELKSQMKASGRLVIWKTKRTFRGFASNGEAQVELFNINLNYIWVLI